MPLPKNLKLRINMNAPTEEQWKYLHRLERMNAKHHLVFHLCRVIPIRSRAKWMARLTGEPVSACHDLLYCRLFQHNTYGMAASEASQTNDNER